MQFSGSLEDVSIIDVLQILGLTGKDGKLKIQAPDREAEVTFRGGRVSAASLRPQKTFMTERLLQKGQIRFEVLHEALQRQRELPCGEQRPIGSLLLELGAITQDQLRQALYEHIQTVINEVAGWTLGSFFFELGAVSSADALGLHPSDLQAPPEVNLQELILEAARVYDEARHQASADVSVENTDASSGMEAVDGAGVLLVTDDLLVQYGIDSALRLPRVATVPSLGGFARQLEGRLLPPKLVVLDLDFASMEDGHGVCALELLRPLVTGDMGVGLLTFGRLVPPWLLQLMAVTSRVEHVPRPSPTTFRDPGVARSFVEALLTRIRRAGALGTEDASENTPESSGPLRRLYQSILGLRSSRHSMTVSLELLRYVAGELERAVLLMVQDGHLLALGFFGVAEASTQRDSSPGTRLRVPLQSDSILTTVVREQRLIHHRLAADPGDSGLDLLFGQIGAPLVPEAYLVPLVVRNRTFAVVYADNGSSDAPLGPGEAVGILAEHGSQLLENLLLVRQAERRAPHAQTSAAMKPSREACVEPAA